MTQHAEITLRMHSVSQLLLLAGVSFYGKRSLNPDAEEYIVEQAARLPRRVPICLMVEVPADETSKTEELGAAVRRHFAFLRENSERKLKHTLQLGFRNLLIGFVFLGLMVLLVEAGSRIMPEGRLATIIRESLIILAWVALWRPADLLLYEWFPYKRDAKLFGRLENSKVQILEKGK